MRLRRIARLALPVAVTWAAASPSGWPSCPLPVFRPALEAPRPGDVHLRAGRSTCTSLEIDVVPTGVEGLFTLAFDLRYPAELLKYEGHAAGPLLARGAPRTPPLFLVRHASPGRLEVTMTRFAPDGAVAGDGSESLLTLRFSRLAGGTGPVDFGLDPGSTVAERVVDDKGQAVSPRFGPGHGGTVTVP